MAPCSCPYTAQSTRKQQGSHTPQFSSSRRALTKLSPSSQPVPTRAFMHLSCYYSSYLLPKPITYCKQLGFHCQGAIFPVLAITGMICENSSPASPSVSALLLSSHTLNPIKSNGVRWSSPLLSMASFQPDSLKLPYPQNSKRSSSKTLYFIITSCIPACQSLIGKTAKPAFRFANCCRRNASTARTADNYFLAQQFLGFQGVGFYKNSLSSLKRRNVGKHSHRRGTL